MEYLFHTMGNEYQICGLSLVFATAKHGYSMTTLYANAEKFEGCKGMFFCIKTPSGSVFGGFCTAMFKITQVYYVGSEESYVYTLQPKRAIYKSAGLNTFFLCCDNNYFTFGGGGEGEAIRVNEDFASGATYSSETFSNKPLTEETKDKQFKCADFEVYALKA